LKLQNQVIPSVSTGSTTGGRQLVALSGVISMKFEPITLLPIKLEIASFSMQQVRGD